MQRKRDATNRSRAMAARRTAQRGFSLAGFSTDFTDASGNKYSLPQARDSLYAHKRLSGEIDSLAEFASARLEPGVATNMLLYVRLQRRKRKEARQLPRVGTSMKLTAVRTRFSFFATVRRTMFARNSSAGFIIVSDFAWSGQRTVATADDDL